MSATSSTSDTMSLEEKLKAIEDALKNAAGDSKKEAQLLSVIADPQDSLNCEGCQ